MAINNGYLCFCCTCLQKGLPDLAAVTYVEPFVSSTSTGIMVRPHFAHKNCFNLHPATWRK